VSRKKDGEEEKEKKKRKNAERIRRHG